MLCFPIDDRLQWKYLLISPLPQVLPTFDAIHVLTTLGLRGGEEADGAAILSAKSKSTGQGEVVTPGNAIFTLTCIHQFEC